MLGLKLFASFNKTRQTSGNELQDKFQKTVGAWRLRFMELTQRPFSCNTYLLPKAWYRCHVVPLRVGDEDNLKKQVNSFVFIDQGEKPKDFTKYSARKNGGLGMHCIKYKAKAMLLKNFLEMAANPKFIGSLLYKAIFQHYVTGETNTPVPQLPMAIKYSDNFFSEIKAAVTDGLEVATMSSKEWYQYLLEKYVFKFPDVQQDGSHIQRTVQHKCEEKLLSSNWTRTWQRANAKILRSSGRSFMFRILHDLHRTGERESKTNRSVMSPHCTLCNTNSIDNIMEHTFTCAFNNNAMNWLVSKIKAVDPTIYPQKLLLLDFEASNDIICMACTWIISETLSFVWARRKQKKQTNLTDLVGTLQINAKVLGTSNSFQNVGKMILNMLE